MKNLISLILVSLMIFGFGLTSDLKAKVGEEFTEVVFVLDYTGHKKPSKNELSKRYNERLKHAVQTYWDLDMDYKFMEQKEAYKYIGKNKSAIVAEIERVIELGTQRTETTIAFRKGKMLKLLLEVRLPASTFTEADYAFAIMHSQFMYRNMGKWKKPSKELPKEFGHILKKKTLLVSETSFSKKFTKEDFASQYPNKFEVVTKEKLDDAILTKDDTHLVLYEASDPGNVSNTNYSYWNIYQPNDGVVICRHSGGSKGLSEADVVLILKATSRK